MKALASLQKSDHETEKRSCKAKNRKLNILAISFEGTILSNSSMRHGLEE
tara:strand:+ start:159 stop:308 length:150 start_codon:yes stop_codon:yes gene_type:complete